MAVTGVDTRALTRHIRERGAMRAVVSTRSADAEALRAAARRVPQMAGRDLAAAVTCGEPREVAPEGPVRAAHHVVAIDYGLKRSMLQFLVDVGCRVTVVPSTTSADEVLAKKRRRVFLTNGPGDPAAVKGADKTVRRWSARCRSSASAWGTRSSRSRWAARRTR